MNGIEFLKIKDISKVYSGTTPSTKIEANFEGDINWYTPAEITADNLEYKFESERKITDVARVNKNIPLLPEDTILLTSRAPIGKVALAGGECCTNQGFKNIVCNEKKVLPKYLAYWLLNKKEFLNSLGRGATFKEISKKIVEDIIVPVPTLENQRQIVDFLEAVVKVKNKRQSQIAALDELVKSLFVEMFGDPISSRNFPKKPLSEFGNIITGNTPSRKVSDYYGDYIEWIKSDNINTPNHFLTNAEEYLSEKGLEKGRSVPRNSILVTCIAGSKECIGNVAIADRTVAFNQQINAIIPEGNPYFLYTQFLVGKKLVQQASTNGMKGLVSKGTFQKIEFISPPLDLQNDFGNKFLSIQNQKQLLQDSLYQIEDLYNTLLQKAFKGELFQD